MPAAAPLPARDGLRPYQRHAVTAWRARLETDRAALGVMFTGAGKTRTAGTFIHEWTGGRVLWLAMRDFLLDQAARAMGQITGEWIGREQAQDTSRGERIIVGSVQTLKGKRLAAWPKDSFSLIAFDEAHHAIATGPRAIFNHFETAKIIGMTATPYRLDEIGLHNVFGDKPAFIYDIQFGQQEGYFCPVVPIARPIESVDLTNVKLQAGDLQLGQLEEQIAKAAAPIARIAWEESESGALPTLVYTPGVASAHSVCDIINQLACKSVAVAVDKDTPDWRRKKILEAFGHEIRFIVNCQIYTEGLDVPLARCIVIARLTESLSLYQQMAGRGGRPAEGIGQLETKEERIAAIERSSKPWFKLVDITGRAGMHTLVSAIDALTGKDCPENIKNAAKEILRNSPGTKLDEAIKQAKAEAAKKEREEIERARDKIALAGTIAEIKTSRTTFDAFSRLGVDVEPDGIEPEWLQQLPTAEQLHWLKENKLPTDVSRGKCVQLQKQAREWKKQGKCSFNQRRLLARAGFDIEMPSSVAKRVISVMIENNFKPWLYRKEALRIIEQGRTVGEEG